ncbi:MAG: DUF2892 domain-containing protein [Gammaproteobacteria bacterium]
MCNLNTLSQILRIVIGLILIGVAWFGPQTSILPLEWMKMWSLGWLGFIPLISGIAAFCPIYAVFGFGHKPDKKH